MTAREIAVMLGGRRSGSGWVARCPAHEDRTPSLSISERGGRVLVHCHSGCAQASVIGALRERGLWPQPERTQTPEERQAAIEARRRDRIDRPAAEAFADAATALGEELLQTLPVADLDRGPITALLRALSTDSGRLAEYRAWRERWPELTVALAAAGQNRRKRLENMIRWYLAQEGNDDGNDGIAA